MRDQRVGPFLSLRGVTRGEYCMLAWSWIQPCSISSWILMSDERQMFHPRGRINSFHTNVENETKNLLCSLVRAFCMIQKLQEVSPRNSQASRHSFENVAISSNLRMWFWNACAVFNVYIYTRRFVYRRNFEEKVCSLFLSRLADEAGGIRTNIQHELI